MNETGFNGLVEDLRIYGGALTRSEVAELVTSTTVGRRKYLQTAYLTLLSLNGTSFDELRLMRAVEDPDKREKFASRLGVRLRAGRPDQLDDLLRPLDALTEAWLEETFGLRDHGRDPLSATPKGRLVEWRQAALRSAWQVQDDVPSRTNVPVLDPGLVRADDVVESSGLRALLEDRRRQLQQRRDDIDRARSVAAEPAAGYLSAVTVGLGIPAARIEELRACQAAGTAIKDELATLHLTSSEFGRLLVLGDLARQRSMTDFDWTELSAVLTSAYRRSLLHAWRQVERTAVGGRPVTLGPDLFLFSERSFDLVDPELRVLRSDWEERLNSRIEQHLAVETANAASIIQAEETVLPALRDVLAGAAAKVLGVADPVDALSQRLLIDTAASGTSPGTTRAMFAVEMVGGLLFALRTRRLSLQHPAATWTVTDSAGFDADWPWMSSFEAWQAAMLAFFYPENMLYPALRPGAGRSGTPSQTAAFEALLTRLRARDGTQTERVQQALADFTQQRKKGEAPIPDDYSPAPSAAATHRTLNDLLGSPSATPSIDVQEVLYFAPLAVALQLHRWGSYAEALDWFRLVYDDSAMPADRRVYWGLRQEQNTAPSLSRPQGWLRDLNPHVLAEFHGGNPYTRFTIMAIARCLLDFADAEFTRDMPDSLARARSLFLTAHDLLAADELTQPQASSRGPLPENPVLTFLKLRTNNQLRKLREGRNIAGMQRPEDDQSAAPAGPVFDDAGVPVLPGRGPLRPTGHRYAVLVERARRLVALAGQVEAAYLSAMERQDAETYRALEAGQHLALAQQGMQLQQQRLTEAADSQQLASRRQRRVQILQTTYGDWLEAGENDWEKATLGAYVAGGIARAGAILFQTGAALADAAIKASAASPTTAPAAGTGVTAFTGFTVAGAIASGIATTAETTAQVSSLQASWERRRDEWELQRNLADQDYLISSQETRLADDHQQIVTQESAIAKLQTDHATAVATYLATKFLNRELYEWMSGVLGDVYAYFLQQATALALLAHQQLAFERQVVPPNFIKDDYWSAPQSDGGQTNADRRGLTGSVRLLQDIEKLDQYAFENDRRMLNLSQTFSLAALAPFEFEQFRASGVLPFTTPMHLFDRSFPGHYLRLIRRVRVSLIALVPPTQGIRATLTASGLSRVVVQHESFQPVVVRRDPEQVALTSSANATGVFELDSQPDLLLPFEAMGVDTSWEFQLPKAANPLDYNSIADVLVSIDYTALADPDYRRQVIEGLGRRVSAERSYSLRSDFQDAWYDLNNPSQSGEAVTIRFETRRTDFPPNLDNLRIGQLLLYVATTSGTTGSLDINLHLRPSDAAIEDPPVGGPATTTADGLISTRRANGSGWLSLVGASPCGTWELELEGAFGELLAGQTLTDVLFVVSFVAESPPWPSW